MQIPFFNPWMIANPTLPKLYWETKSPEQLVANLYCILDKLTDYVNGVSGQVNINADDIQALKELFQQFQESGFDDYYKAQLQQFIEDHPELLWAAMGQMVFFGLTDDGRFCAYVPDSWSGIVFDTGAVYGTEQYGRLILRYNTSGEGAIDNTDPYYPAAHEDIEQLKIQVAEMRHTLYTALTKER